MKAGNVELHIEELAFHGFAPSDQYRIVEAVEGELARLLAERGVGPSLTQSGEVTHMDGGKFDVAAGSSGEVVGGQIARALHGGLKR